MSPITSGSRNTRTTGSYGAASADNGCRDNHTSAAPKSPPIAIDTRPASLFHRSTPVEYPISTAVGGIAGNRYRTTLSPGDNVRNARTVTTHTAQNRNTEDPPARACQPSRRPGHNQPVHGSIPNGKKMTYASHPVQAGAALGLESAGWKNRPIPRDPLRKNVSTNALPCRRPAATNHGAATMRKAETATAVCRSQARGHFGRSRARGTVTISTGRTAPIRPVERTASAEEMPASAAVRTWPSCSQRRYQYMASVTNNVRGISCWGARL